MPSTQPIEKVNKAVLNVCFMLIATAVGMLFVLEFGINISLSKWIKHPLRSAWINFLVATLCLLPLFIVCKTDDAKRENQNYKGTLKLCFSDLIESSQEDRSNYFVFFNGLLGVIAVCSPIFIAPLIGFPLYTISVICGQIISSVLIDNYGLLWTEIKKLSVINFVGAVSTIFGIMFYQIPSFHNNDQTHNKIVLMIVYVCIAITAGICLTVQIALNRRLQFIMNSTPFQASFLSFFNAALIMTVINIIFYIIEGDWFVKDDTSFRWYIFLGGFTGAIEITMLIICPSYIGFVAMFICVVFGSLVMSVIFDYIHAFGINTHDQFHKSLFRVFGVLFVFVGAILVNITYKKPIYHKVITRADICSEKEKENITME